MLNFISRFSLKGVEGAKPIHLLILGIEETTVDESSCVYDNENNHILKGKSLLIEVRKEEFKTGY